MWRNDPIKYVLIHAGRKWRFMEDNNRRWFVRDDGNNDTGPFSSLDEAREWVKTIRKTPKWQPIETAPCNDTFVLVYWRDGNMSVEDLDHATDPQGWAKHGATHWMPLPEPPKESDDAVERVLKEIEAYDWAGEIASARSEEQPE